MAAAAAAVAAWAALWLRWHRGPLSSRSAPTMPPGSRAAASQARWAQRWTSRNGSCARRLASCLGQPLLGYPLLSHAPLAAAAAVAAAAAAVGVAAATAAASAAVTTAGPRPCGAWTAATARARPSLPPRSRPRAPPQEETPLAAAPRGCREGSRCHCSPPRRWPSACADARANAPPAGAGLPHPHQPHRPHRPQRQPRPPRPLRPPWSSQEPRCPVACRVCRSLPASGRAAAWLSWSNMERLFGAPTTPSSPRPPGLRRPRRG